MDIMQLSKEGSDECCSSLYLFFGFVGVTQVVYGLLWNFGPAHRFLPFSSSHEGEQGKFTFH